MDTIQQGVGSTIAITWTVNGEPTDPDPDTATITITKDSDGTAVVTDDPTTDDVGTPGKFTYTLTPAQTADLDVYEADWSAEFNGETQVIRTEVEIAGGNVFTIAEARAADTELADTTKYSAAQIVQARNLAVQALEEACGVAFVPRYAKETTAGMGGSGVRLKWAHVRNIRSGSVDGTDLTSGEIPDVFPNPIGLSRTAGWTKGWSNVEVVYEHGYDRPPARAQRAAIRLTRHYLTQFPIDDRTIRLDMETGSAVMAQPGIRGNSFGIPEVDSFVADHDLSVPVG